MRPETRYATPQLRRTAAWLLGHEAGTAPATSEHLAAASGRVLDKFWQRLAEVIGWVGVQAIFLRTVTLLHPEFVFLDERLVLRERGEGLAEPLRACLREQDPEVIQEASVILFATFAGVLATVVGERLVWILLQQIWSDTLPSAAGPQEAAD